MLVRRLRRASGTRDAHVFLFASRARRLRAPHESPVHALRAACASSGTAISPTCFVCALAAPASPLGRKECTGSPAAWLLPAFLGALSPLSGRTVRSLPLVRRSLVSVLLARLPVCADICRPLVLAMVVVHTRWG